MTSINPAVPNSRPIVLCLKDTNNPNRSENDDSKKIYSQSVGAPMMKMSAGDIKDVVKNGSEIIAGLIVLDNSVKELTGVSFKDVVAVTKEWISGKLHKPKAETPKEVVPLVIQEPAAQEIPKEMEQALDVAV